MDALLDTLLLTGALCALCVVLGLVAELLAILFPDLGDSL